MDGVIGMIPSERVAVWGLSVEGRRVLGCDTSTRAAEHYAAMMALVGAKKADQDTWLLIDNSAVA